MSIVGRSLRGLKTGVLMICFTKPICICFAIPLTLVLLSTYAHGQSQFQQALTQGDVNLIRTMVDRDSKLLAQPLPQARETPLHLAIQRGNLQVVKLLLELGAPLDDNNPPKLTPLHSALSRGNPEIFELILEKTDDVNAGDRNGATPLMYTVMFQNSRLENVDRLLAKGADINAVNSSKQTALHLAGYYRRPECGLQLIKAGADLTAVDNQGATPFLAACTSSAKLAADLLARGVDPLVRNRHAQTALHLACQSNRLDVVNVVIDRFEDVDLRDNQNQTPLQLAVYRNNTKLVQLLLDRGADPNVFTSRQGQNKVDPVICYPAETGNQVLLKILIDGGAKVNVQNQNGDTPLHLAAQGGHVVFGGTTDPKNRQGFVDSIKILINHKTDFNNKNNNDETPIEIAAKADFFDAVELLVEKSVALNFDLGSGSLMHWAAKNGLVKTMTRLIAEQKDAIHKPDPFGLSPLHLAAANGHVKVVDLLIKNKAEIDRADEDGLTALMYASEGGHAKVAQSLVDAGADLSRLDASGQSALHLAAWNGGRGVVAVLLSKTDKSDLKTQTGYTPLHAAAWQGYTAIVRQLLDSGADANATDSDGWTPLHKAAYRGHAEAVKELVKQGADKDRVTGAGMTALSMAESNQKAEVATLLK